MPWYLWLLAPFVLVAAIPLVLPLGLLALVSIPLRMRFHFGPIPVSPDFVPDAPWARLREPSPWLEKFMVLPGGVVAAAIVAGLWLLVTPLRLVAPAVTLPGLLLLFAGIVVGHELLHMLAHSGAGRSPQSVLGFSPAQAFFYGNYAGEMSRSRFLAILLMPLLLISIVPLLVSAAAQAAPGWVAFVSLFHAFLAFSDMLLAGLVLFQAPNSGVIRQRGWRTYCRGADL